MPENKGPRPIAESVNDWMPGDSVELSFKVNECVRMFYVERIDDSIITLSDTLLTKRHARLLAHSRRESSLRRDNGSAAWELPSGGTRTGYVDSYEILKRGAERLPKDTEESSPPKYSPKVVRDFCKIVGVDGKAAYSSEPLGYYLG